MDFGLSISGKIDPSAQDAVKRTADIGLFGKSVIPVHTPVVTPATKCNVPFKISTSYYYFSPFIMENEPYTGNGTTTDAVILYRDGFNFQ